MNSLSRWAIVFCSLAMSTIGTSSANANPVSEIRAGVYYHDAVLKGNTNEVPKADLNLDILFNSPSWLSWAYAPRPHIGGTLNTGGATSLAFAGLEWDFDLFQDLFHAEDRLFLGMSLDGAIHDGPISSPPSVESDSYGCRLNFHESVSIGYRIGHQSIMGTIEHMSNAGLCSENDGLTNIGLRYGYHF